MNKQQTRQTITHTARTNQFIEYGAILIGLTILFYFAVGDAIKSRFSLIDDHQIYNVATSSASFINALWDGFMANLIEGGRFRPGYVLFYNIETALFGTDPKVWHLAFIGYGILTCFLFYLTARKTGADIISAIYFVLLLAVTGPQNSVWYRLGTGETWGILLTALATLSIVLAAKKDKANIWDVVAILFLFILSSPKESFALVIPSLLGLRVLLHKWWHKQSWRDTLITLKLPLIAGSAALIIQLLLIGAVLRFRPDQYGATVAGLSSSSFFIPQWYTLVTTSDLSILAWYVPIFLALLLLFAIKNNRIQLFALVFILTLAWIVPQLILYSNFIYAHYLFPIVVSFAAVCALGLAVLWKKRHWILWGICAIWLAVPIVNGFISTGERISAFKANTVALDTMIKYLATHTAQEDNLIIVSNPVDDYERSISMRTHLRFAGVDNPVFLLPVFGKDEDRHHPLANALTNRWFADFTNLETLQADDVNAIIGFRMPDSSTKIPTWYTPKAWKEVQFTYPYYKFSLGQLKYKEAGDYTFTILVHND